MTVSIEQRLFAEQHIRETFEKLNCSIPYNIEWNSRFRRRIADATYYHDKNYGRIRLSTFFWPFMDDTKRSNTLVHEVCHIVDNKYVADMRAKGYNISSLPHGKRWQKLMLQCGEEPTRQWLPDFGTSMKILKATGTTTVKAKCECQTHHITKNRATRMRNGSIYHCINCKQKINLILGK